MSVMALIERLRPKIRSENISRRACGISKSFWLVKGLDLSFWCAESELRYRKPVKVFGSFPKVFPESPGLTESSMSKNLYSRLVPSPPSVFSFHEGKIRF